MKETNNNKREDFLPETLRDRYMYTHRVVKELAQGGQGKVLTTEDETVIIKLATKNIGTQLLPVHVIVDKKKYPEDFQRLQTLFQSIKLLPLPKNIHVTVPQALLLDKAGYVMRFMEKSEKLYDSICNTNNLLEYAKTGGTRRRLEISCKAFAILSQLHSSGLIYGDITPNNIYITKNINIKFPNVWFIDSDNMHRVSGLPNCCFTPMFAAPEVAKGISPNTQESDIYSLAITCFYLCASVYPFYGNLIEGEDWAADSKAEDEDVYTKAHNGDFPFIDDFGDDSNFSEDGLPRELVFTDELRFLFNKMFSKESRSNPELRPTAYHWIRAFSRAADISVMCQSEACIKDYQHSEIKSGESVSIRNMTYLMKSTDCCCPYCDTPFTSGVILLRDNEVVFAREFSIADEKNYTVSIPERVFKVFNIETNDQNILTINIQRNITDNLVKLIIPKTSFSIENSFSAKIDYKNSHKLTSFICDKDQDIDCNLSIKIGNMQEKNYRLIIKIPKGVKK